MEWQLVLSIISVVLVLLGFYSKVSRDRDADIKNLSKDFDAKLAEAIKAGDDKRAKIWEKYDALKKEHLDSMDKIRNEHQTNYVSVDLCRIVHANNDRVLERIDKSLATIIEQLGKLSELVFKRDTEK